MVSATSTRTQSGDIKFASDRARSTFDDVLKEARRAFETTNEKSYQGPLLADPQPAQERARQDLLGVAGQMQGDGQQLVDIGQAQQGAGQGTINLGERLQGTGQQAVNTAQRLQGSGQPMVDQAARLRGSGQPIIDLAQDTAQGEYLDVRNRPEFQANIEAAIEPAREQLTQEILPQAQSAAIQAGAYGGDRDQLNRRVALEDFSEQASQTASQIAAQAYEAERDRQQQAGQLMAQGVDVERSIGDLARRGVALESDVANLAQQGISTEARISDLIRSGAATENDIANLIRRGRSMQMQGPSLAEQIGARQRADQQARFDAQQRRFQMEQQAPWIGLPQYAQIATGTPTTSTSTVQQTPSESQQVGNYIQAGLGAAGTISQLGTGESGEFFGDAISGAADFVGGLF